MELYAAVRRSVYVEGLSERAAARRFGLARETVRKMLRYRLPPGYRRAKPIRRPKLDAFTGVIDQILRDDQDRPKKQHRRSYGREELIFEPRHYPHAVFPEPEASQVGDIDEAEVSGLGELVSEELMPEPIATSLLSAVSPVAVVEPSVVPCSR